MTYTGEHSLPGSIGHLMVVLSFIAAAYATLSYWMAARVSDPDRASLWKRYARKAVYAHVVTTLVFISLVLWIILKHYFEYQYVFEHSSSSMDLRYLFVCFWSGQEGSFMLWIFWHAVLAILLMRTSKDWESPVMTVFMGVQAFLLTMLLGSYIGDLKIGSSPFALLRDADPNFGPVWSLMPDYLQFDPLLQDGRGLNPLLQNYWMTIHPPTLFLGFALTLVPFCYAIAALWKKQFQTWIKPSLPWVFFGIAVLGTGILMGGAWAYESLSFGGFWAWDPVENASLVPWLTLVGSGHLMLINRNKERSIYSTLFFTLITFILILYSTFLTRSGVLGDTSVHSFTGQDMLGQLLLGLMFFLVLSFALLMQVKKERNKFLVCTGILFMTDVIFWNKLDMALIGQDSFQLTIRGLITILFITCTIIFLIRSYALSFGVGQEEDAITSREFWMFIGSLILLLSALHIIISTSLPVINMLFKTETVISQDERNAFYNKWQVPFALIVSVLLGFSQYLKYKNTPGSKILKDQIRPLAFSVMCTILVRWFFPFEANPIVLTLMLFGGFYALFANLDYYFLVLKGSVKNLGPATAHVGFALILLGSLISQGEQKILSKNYKGYAIDLLDNEGGISSGKDVQLFRNDTTALGDYFVLYTGRKRDGINLHFNIHYFERKDRVYHKGQKVKVNSAVFNCKQDHTASMEFITDLPKWERVSDPDAATYFSTQVWENGQAGKELFTLHPFIQMNPMQKVAEPGTKHYWSYDVFTHIKYAELTGAEDEWMDPISLKGTGLNDTLWTAGYKIVLSQPAFIDTLGFKVHQLQVTIFDHQDRDKKYGLSTRVHMAVDSTGKITQPFSELKAAGIQVRLEKVNPFNMHDPESKPYELTFLTQEYLILHAIRFPYISILWIGCILMALGSLWAVVVRIRKANA